MTTTEKSATNSLSSLGEELMIMSLLSKAYHRVLCVLVGKRTNGLFFSDIAALACVSKRHLQRLIKRLCADGIVVKETVNQKDSENKRKSSKKKHETCNHNYKIVSDKTTDDEFIKKYELLYENVNKYVTPLCPISTKQEIILFLIQCDSHITFARIAAKLGIPKSTVSYHVTILRKKGLVKRKGTNRQGYWTLTSNGLKCYESALEKYSDHLTTPSTTATISSQYLTHRQSIKSKQQSTSIQKHQQPTSKHRLSLASPNYVKTTLDFAAFTKKASQSNVKRSIRM